jgi:hypothetical protein
MVSKQTASPGSHSDPCARIHRPCQSYICKGGTTNKYLLQKHIYARIYPLTNNLFIMILASLHNFSQKNKTDALWVLRASSRIFLTRSFSLVFFSPRPYLFSYFFLTTFYFLGSHLVRIRGCAIARIFARWGLGFASAK